MVAIAAYLLLARRVCAGRSSSFCGLGARFDLIILIFVIDPCKAKFRLLEIFVDTKSFHG